MEIAAWYAYGLSFITLCWRLLPSGGHVVTGHETIFRSHPLAGFPFFLAFGLPLVVCLVVCLIPVLRGWLRLRHVANVWDEIPLRNE
jgi:hypothetical protein